MALVVKIHNQKTGVHSGYPMLFKYPLLIQINAKLGQSFVRLCFFYFNNVTFTHLSRVSTCKSQMWQVSFTSSLRAFIMARICHLQHVLRMVTIVAYFGTVFVCGQQCSSTHTCHYENTESLSTLFLEFHQTKTAHISCLSHCTREPSCRAVTHDPAADICRLHYEADNIACLQMAPAFGKSLWVIPACDPSNVQCCKVGLLILPIRVKGYWYCCLHAWDKNSTDFYTYTYYHNNYVQETQRY